jgi:hypothetical protein
MMTVPRIFARTAYVLPVQSALILAVTCSEALPPRWADDLDGRLAVGVADGAHRLRGTLHQLGRAQGSGMRDRVFRRPAQASQRAEDKNDGAGARHD